MGHWASGIGHGALGMGQGFANLKVGALGMGHGALGISPVFPSPSIVKRQLLLREDWRSTKLFVFYG
ncbi:hypothetical protein [Microcoleus sp. FACHB-68]|uniref:hypothetical protein n=1 Tax=Microcoleus sp. FACHB-68 TaxID=2692826 RepID=UPI001687F22E|nr:hypothetical protein [Microcoleus sp. FACHB-68]MBD1939739.1 hypothetical protein [Microcoleus sp. FACHB-68]